MNARAVAIADLMRRYAFVLADLREFSARLSGTGAEYAYAFEWSASAISLAGEAKVLQDVLSAVWKNEETKPLSLEAIRDHARSEALRGAKYPSRSTSPVSNLLADAVVSAWASLAIDLAAEVGT